MALTALMGNRKNNGVTILVFGIPLSRIFLVGMAVAIWSAFASAQVPKAEKPVEKATKLVDQQQLAVVLKNDNKRMTVILVSLDSKELQYKLNPNEKTSRIYTAKSGYIKAIQIESGEMFGLNPKTAAFEPYDPATNTFTAAPKNDAKAIGKEVGPTKDNKQPQTENVVAEGVGATADDALKDAFRNAVRQVVGAVVDAETLVRNDEIISDKVLTYSDGFVKTYEEISNKHEKGLFRTKIKATVERRSVVAKLKAANVAVKDIDGKGIFAEVVTQLDAEKNAKQLVEKALQGFPLNAIQAEVIGKPLLVEKRADGVKVQITVRYQADRKAYVAFARQLQTTLENTAKAKGEFMMSALAVNGDPAGRHAYYKEHTGTEDHRLWASYIPRHFKNHWDPENEKQVIVALNTQYSNDKNKTVWVYYVLDESVRLPLQKCYERSIAVRVSLLGGDGKVIAIERILAADVSEMRANSAYRRFPVTLISSCFGDVNRPKKEPLYFISPLFFEHVGRLHYREILSQHMQFSLSLDDLKAVERIKCELLLD